jgi:hypothetical protein
MQSEAHRLQATIADLAAITDDARHIAEVAASTWREIHAVLAPVIGPGGVAALYQRSLYVTRTAYPCLAAAREDLLRADKFAALQLVLSQQTSAQVAAANGALLQNFSELLANLIGVSLAERLLRSVHSLPRSRPADQEPST